MVWVSGYTCRRPEKALCPGSPHRVQSALTSLFGILLGFKWMTN